MAPTISAERRVQIDEGCRLIAGGTLLADAAERVGLPMSVLFYHLDTDARAAVTARRTRSAKMCKRLREAASMRPAEPVKLWRPAPVASPARHPDLSDDQARLAGILGIGEAELAAALRVISASRDPYRATRTGPSRSGITAEAAGASMWEVSL